MNQMCAEEAIFIHRGESASDPDLGRFRVCPKQLHNGMLCDHHWSLQLVGDGQVLVDGFKKFRIEVHPLIHIVQ